MATLTLLAGSTNALAATENLIRNSDSELGTAGQRLNSAEAYRLAPPAPRLAKGLPLAKRLNDGVLLPTETAHGLHVYVVELELYPQQAQAAMDALADVLTTEFEEARKVDAAKASGASDQRSASAEAHKLTFAKGALIGGIGVVLGIVATAYLEHKR